MPETLPAVVGKIKAVYRLVRACGPLLISQSDKMSEAFSRHQFRLAEVEAAKQFMSAEAQNLASIRQRMREKYLDATPEERIRLRQDMEATDKEIRQIGTYQKAIDYIPEQNALPPPPAAEEEKAENFSAWIDTFNEFSRKKNEPWREDLLAKALAKEASTPGTFGQRALWFLGTMDEKTFNALAAILDIALNISGTYIIPNHNNYDGTVIPTSALPSHLVLGNLIFIINGLGLFGDPLTTQQIIKQNVNVVCSYGNRSAVIHVPQEMRISGIVLTDLGMIISSLYTPKINAVGNKIFDDWLDHIKSTTTLLAMTRV